MRLFHPQVAKLSCSDCQKYVVDIKTWEIKKYQSGKQMERDKGDIGPIKSGTCQGCPKNASFPEDNRGPQNERYCKLWPENVATIELYHRFRACGWDGLPTACKGDTLLVNNFSIIDRLIRESESHQLGRNIALELLPILTLGKC
jgi:hypothetical protein